MDTEEGGGGGGGARVAAEPAASPGAVNGGAAPEAAWAWAWAWSWGPSVRERGVLRAVGGGVGRRPRQALLLLPALRLSPVITKRKDAVW